MAPSRLDGKHAAQVALGFAALGVVCAALLCNTLARYPLFPLQTQSLDWSLAWLATTVVDYYGSTLCLVAVIVASERTVVAVLWSLGCLLLGSPFCCAYMALRVLRHRSVALVDAATQPARFS